MTNLFRDVSTSIAANPHGWTSVSKGCIMAAIVVALRPKFSIEIGVYAGKGLVALGLAHKAIGHGMAIGIDPYSREASSEGQTADHAKFWGSLDHEAVYKAAQDQIHKWSIKNTARIERCRSDAFDPPDGIGFLRVDGNHSEQALRDVERYAPFVQRGGILMLDDVEWSGGGVQKALVKLNGSGWRELYKITEPDTNEVWVALQKL